MYAPRNGDVVMTLATDSHVLSYEIEACGSIAFQKCMIAFAWNLGPKFALSHVQTLLCVGVVEPQSSDYGWTNAECLVYM